MSDISEKGRAQIAKKLLLQNTARTLADYQINFFTTLETNEGLQRSEERTFKRNSQISAECEPRGGLICPSCFPLLSSMATLKPTVPPPSSLAAARQRVVLELPEAPSQGVVTVWPVCLPLKPLRSVCLHVA